MYGTASYYHTLGQGRAIKTAQMVRGRNIHHLRYYHQPGDVSDFSTSHLYDKREINGGKNYIPTTTAREALDAYKYA